MNVEFGKRLRQARRQFAAATEQDVTQEVVAKLVGTTQGAVGKWETGKREPDLNTVLKLARLLRVEPAYLAWGPEGLTAPSSSPERTRIIDGTPPTADGDGDAGARERAPASGTYGAKGRRSRG